MSKIKDCVCGTEYLSKLVADLKVAHCCYGNRNRKDQTAKIIVFMRFCTVAHKCNTKILIFQYKKININTKIFISVQKYLSNKYKNIYFSTKIFISVPLLKDLPTYPPNSSARLWGLDKLGFVHATVRVCMCESW